mmetsp:Transcript_96290/g.300607  ORF Transcript_96290/g.300607 Transcript_96290/m.300607 type:complete len:371 (+) Transcript_96290:65-1177(+)
MATVQAPVRAVVVTLGGEREAAMRRQLEEVGGFDAHFIEGVPARSLRTRDGLIGALRATGIFCPAPTGGEGDLVGQVTPGTPEAQAPGVDSDGLPWLDEEEERRAGDELWLRSRSLSRDRAVLACVFAHLLALRVAESEGRPVIMEDNARLLAEPGASAARARHALDAAPETAWLLLGYGSGEGLLEQATSPVSALFWEEGKPAAWGTQCYRLEPAARMRLIAWLRKGVECLLPAKGKRCRGYKPRPIDRLLPAPFVAEGRSAVAFPPVAYRAPMLRSLIHEQWDAAMSEALERQLARTGDSFDHLWLTEEERLVVARWREQGVWEHGDGITRENWVRKPRKPRKPKVKASCDAEGGGGPAGGEDESSGD